MEIEKKYKEWIAERNEREHINAHYELLEVEQDHTHALVKQEIMGNAVTNYILYNQYEDGTIEYIKSWQDFKMAQMAFELFCHKMPDVVERYWEDNRQIALYDDENRRLRKEIIRLKAAIKGIAECI